MTWLVATDVVTASAVISLLFFSDSKYTKKRKKHQTSNKLDKRICIGSRKAVMYSYNISTLCETVDSVLITNQTRSCRKETVRLRRGSVLAKYNWKTIFCWHYRSVFKHCDIIGLQSYEFGEIHNIFDEGDKSYWSEQLRVRLTPARSVGQNCRRIVIIYDDVCFTTAGQRRSCGNAGWLCHCQFGRYLPVTQLQRARSTTWNNETEHQDSQVHGAR